MKRIKYNKKNQIQNKAKKIIAPVLIFLLIGLPLKPLLANGEEIVNIGVNTVLTADINGRVVITANNITLDCNGYKIIGTSDGDEDEDGYNDGNGIYLYSKNNVTVKNCVIENFETGIYSISSSSNTYKENNILSNLYEGIFLSNSNNNSFIGNDISNNRYNGIQLSDSNYNNINNNKISYNSFNSLGVGISLFNSSHNNIFENNISKNEYGVNILYVDAYSKNLVYHNNFIGNTFQAWIYPNDRNDLFDNGYPDGGNYWSDYAGIDLQKGENQNENGSDGIGDIPYIFPEGNTDPYIGGQDKYPFMEENGWQEDVPEWRKDIQPGDILYDAGALPIKRRGIILYSIGHIGMYVGDVEIDGEIFHNQVVEANKKTEDGRRGVQYRNIETWDYPKRKLVYLLRVNASNEKKENVVTFTKEQIKKPYKFPWLTKDPDPDSPSWYCSELVWAAYYNQRINLEEGEEPFDNPVAPSEIYNDTDTLVVADHLNYLAYYAEEYLKSIIFQIFSPVNVEITNPDGNVISKEIDDIDDAVYIIDDLDDDGDYEDTIGIETRKMGTYTIRITPKVGADPDDTYTLKVIAGDAEIIWADLSIGELIESGFKIFTIYSNPNDINGEPVDKNTPQCFHDEETSSENLFSAGILDFSLNSPRNFFPTTTPTTTSSRDINIANDGNLGFQYTVTTTNATDTLCEHLNLTANLDGNPVYEGPLASFNYNAGEFSNSTNAWQFTATLNDNDPALQNQTCNFDFVFDGSQISGAGFSDEEIISNTVDSGSWAITPPTPPEPGDVIINEVMWMGSKDIDKPVKDGPKDQWVELKNVSGRDLHLKGLYLTYKSNASNENKLAEINNNRLVRAGEYYLITYYTKDNSAINVSPDQNIDKNFDYGKFQIKLYTDNTKLVLIDTAGDGIGEPAKGDKNNFYSMERNDIPGNGTDYNNWHSCLDPNSTALYWDTGRTEQGTPGYYNLSANDPSADDYQDDTLPVIASEPRGERGNPNGDAMDDAIDDGIASVAPLPRNDTFEVVADEAIRDEEEIILEEDETEIIMEGDVMIGEPEEVDEPKNLESGNDDDLNNLNEQPNE
ncbi:MAG: periplasmic copper-binding [Parcubacteria group bacterium Athens1014_10]|nr:MAG: periplasmic copper-binding [Parcubacteria group bacterium Athens1014_10]